MYTSTYCLTEGVPLAVRRFQKVRTQCNKLICEGLVKSVVGMLHLSHPHILPYLACYDLSHSVGKYINSSARSEEFFQIQTRLHAADVSEVNFIL